MEQIERKLASSAKPAAQQGTSLLSLPCCQTLTFEPFSVAISQAMQAQHATFMTLAGATAHVHAEVERLKAAYTALFRSKMGGGVDPFQVGR